MREIEEYEKIPEPAARARVERQVVREQPWQVQTVQQADMRLAAKLESNRNHEAVFDVFFTDLPDNRALISALIGWEDQFPSPFLNVRTHVTPKQFNKFAERLSEASDVDIRDFQTSIPVDTLPWPVQQILKSDELTAAELQNCENNAERMRLVERFVAWLGNNREIYRALEAWDRTLYNSPFKAVVEQLSDSELVRFSGLIEDITGRNLFS